MSHLKNIKIRISVVTIFKINDLYKNKYFKLEFIYVYEILDCK